MCVNKILNSNLIEVSNDHELLFINIKIMSRTLNICIAYRPPNMSTLENTAMMTFLDSKFHENVNWLLLGDFNYPSIDWFQQTSTVAQEETFLDFANEHNLILQMSII